MEELYCKDCKYFVQHYVKPFRRYIPSGVGHCIQKGMKQRKVTQKVCENFEATKKKKQ